MKKNNFNKIDVDVFYEKLNNGLEIYVAPNKLVNNIYTTFSTKFGSNIIEFVPLKENKMIEVPLGIAHFLEHKMFEQSDGKDPFEFFSESGTDANAFTSFTKTSYLFSGSNNFKENLIYLLDYVQSPYFTDENVNKEKGIIEQEIKMYQDDPFWVIYETVLENLLVKDPTRYPIAGTVDSIYKITKEDLYKCYETFYHPSNMFVVVTGNVDPEQVIELIKENQSNKIYQPENEIKIKKYKEPDEVVKTSVVKKMNVTIPKITIGYKISKQKTLKNLNEYTLNKYLNLFFDIKFGETSLFNENLKQQKLTTLDIDLTTINTKTHYIVMLTVETNKPDKVIELIQEEIENREIIEKDFERKRKVLISSIVSSSDNIISINNKIMNNIIDYNEIVYNGYNLCKKLDYEEFLNTVNKLDLKKYTTCLIKPKQ